MGVCQNQGKHIFFNVIFVIRPVFLFFITQVVFVIYGYSSNREKFHDIYTISRSIFITSRAFVCTFGGCRSWVVNKKNWQNRKQNYSRFSSKKKKKKRVLQRKKTARVICQVQHSVQKRKSDSLELLDKNEHPNSSQFQFQGRLWYLVHTYLSDLLFFITYYRTNTICTPRPTLILFNLTPTHTNFQ